MIKQGTIEELRGKMDITEVVSHFIEVKKNKACCPFHDEKSPSFHIRPATQFFKCFGCGEGGDAITFVRKHQKLTFTEAVTWLCNFYNVEILLDKNEQESYLKARSQREEQAALASFAHKKYEQHLFSLPADSAARQFLYERGFSNERIRSWSLGYAPLDWKFLTTHIIEMGKFDPAEKMGLITSRDGKNWDFFRNRIIIPIYDHIGTLVGFGGRSVPAAEDADFKAAKYMNPKESLLYSKSKIWFGLNLAERAIRTEGFAYIVEGYLDVMAMHDHEMHNTIASCGTEIDIQQVRLLKSFTEYVVICYDGDTPGQTKAMKQINLFLENGFKVAVVDLPEGKDPDEYLKADSFHFKVDVVETAIVVEMPA